MSTLGYNETNVRILDWGGEVEENPGYQKSYKKVHELYVSRETFKKDADETTKNVLIGSKRSFDDIQKATETAVHYLLSEIAFLEWASEMFHVKQVSYVYHKNWPVYENYIAGKYDGIPKPYMNFLLMENPWETFNPLWGLEDFENDTFENALDRVEKTKILRVAFSHYPPALMHDEKYENFSGIFYEVIMSIAKKHGWKVVWSEETGYGVIADGLLHNRFDVFGGAVWPTDERKQTASFSESLYESPVFGWVKEGNLKTESEFRSDVNTRVVIKENDITDSITRADYPSARIVYVPQLASTSEVLKFVAEERGDITFAESYLVELFNKKSSVKLVKISPEPVRIFENTFMFQKDDTSLKAVFDTEIFELKKSGELKRLIEKYFGVGNSILVD
jgi:ABC-type amino acid transport substrate-binding protein